MMDDDVVNDMPYTYIATEIGPPETRVIRGKTIEINRIPPFVEENM
jgi:hypothetical protein